MSAGEIIERLRMASERGRLGGAAWDRVRPYIAGARHLFVPTNIMIHCPEYVQPDHSDLPLVERIFAAFKKMKEAQKTASVLYQPVPMWKRLLSKYPITTLSDLHFFLTNFGAWRQYLGIESSVLIRRLSRSLLTRRYMERVVFEGQLLLWRSFSEKPISQLSYPRHGNQAGAFIGDVFVGVGSFDNEAYGSWLSCLIRDIERPVVIELGAGSGKLAYFVLRDFKEFSYADFDLPEMLIVAAYYLMKTFPGKRALLYGEKQYDSSSHEANDLILMPPWEIEKLPDRRADLALNKNSLGEMRRNAVINYVSHITRSSNRFFILNHERSPQTGDGPGMCAHEYPVPSDFKLSLKQRDLWNLNYQGRSSDIFAYLYDRKS